MTPARSKRFVVRRTALTGLSAAGLGLALPVTGRTAAAKTMNTADHPLEGKWLAMASPARLGKDPQFSAPSLFAADSTVVLSFLSLDEVRTARSRRRSLRGRCLHGGGSVWRPEAGCAGGCHTAGSVPDACRAGGQATFSRVGMGALACPRAPKVQKSLRAPARAWRAPDRGGAPRASAPRSAPAAPAITPSSSPPPAASSASPPARRLRSRPKSV
jgi:hypothetical protein